MRKVWLASRISGIPAKATRESGEQITTADLDHEFKNLGIYEFRNLEIREMQGWSSADKTAS